MRYADYKWVEVAYNGPTNRNNIVHVNDVKPPADAKDCYRTIFRYPDEFAEHVKAQGTVKGYSGSVYADFFPLDIDDPQDLNKSLENARTILEKLLANYEINLDELRIYFSGAKGFHILLPATMFGYEPSKQMPAAFRALATEIANGTKIDTAVYDRVRIFRLTNTINSKTGLYKIPLTAAEILHNGVDEIKQLAQAPRQIEVPKAGTINAYLQQAYRQALDKLSARQTKEAQADKHDIKIPKNAKMCYYNILAGVGEGQRDNAGLRLAVHLLKEYPADIVEPMMQAWNMRNRPPMDAENVKKLLNQATGSYDFGCRDSVLLEFCSPKCIFKGRETTKVSASKIYTFDDARAKYMDYIANLQTRKIKIGFDKIDQSTRGIAPGEVMQVMARTGVGKTAFVLNVIRHIIVNQDIPVLFFSMEQPMAQIYERALQISTEKKGSEVERIAVQKADGGHDYMHHLALRCYSKLYIVEEDFLTYEDLRDYIVLAKEKIGIMPPLVCVDYLGRMKGGGRSTYEEVSELAKLLKKMAKELDIAVLYLHQTSRVGKSGAEPLSLDMGRDSGVVEEAADYILGMWRPEIDKPGTQEKDAEEIIIALLKNRRGGLGQAKYKFIKPCLQIVEWNAQTKDPWG